MFTFWNRETTRPKKVHFGVRRQNSEFKKVLYEKVGAFLLTKKSDLSTVKKSTFY